MLGRHLVQSRNYRFLGRKNRLLRDYSHLQFDTFGCGACTQNLRNLRLLVPCPRSTQVLELKIGFDEKSQRHLRAKCQSSFLHRWTF